MLVDIERELPRQESPQQHEQNPRVSDLHDIPRLSP